MNNWKTATILLGILLIALIIVNSTPKVYHFKGFELNEDMLEQAFDKTNGNVLRICSTETNTCIFVREVKDETK